MRYIWLALVVLSGAVEGLTRRFIALSFIPGAIASMILAFCDVKIWIQILVFFASGIVLLILTQTLFRGFYRSRDEKFEIENAIGEKCKVVDRIDNVAGRGAVSIKGYEWAARMVSDETVVEAGTRVEVIAVEGVKVICKKIS